MSRRTQRRNRRSRRRRRRRSRRRRRGGNVKPRYSSNNVGNQAKKAQANVRRASTEGRMFLEHHQKVQHLRHQLPIKLVQANKQLIRPLKKLQM